MTREREFQATSIVVVCVVILLVAGAGGVASESGNTKTVDSVQETTTEDGETDTISVRNLSAPDRVQVGENFTVSADVVNEEDSGVVQRITYQIGGNVVSSELLRIPANNATTVVFNVTGANTSGFPAGTFTHGVYADGAEATANLTLTTGEETTPEETTPAETTPAETTTPADAETTTPEETTTTTEAEETTTEAEETTTPAEAETTPATEETTTPAAEETTPATEETTTPETTTPEETTTEEDAAANISFEEQTSNGTTVVVDSVTVPDGGFVVIHDRTLLQGEAVESIVGQSEFLEAGTNENVIIALDEPLNESQRLVAVVYRDSNENQEFDFVTSNRTADGPYRQPDGRVAVNAIANVTVENGEEQ